MQDKKDDFWNIAALLPKRKVASPPSAYGEVTLPEIRATEGNVPQKDPDVERLHINQREEEALRFYTPEDNPFIAEVRVYSRKSHMHLFHGFKSEGALWNAKRGVPCAYAPFFSYLPQYYQMNTAQKAYYLYFRDEANAGRYLEAGQSYVMLYIFEILNLPDVIPPKIGVLRLANAWAHYRKQLPLLDKNMAVWLADYALLHGVSCPTRLLTPFLDDILLKAAVKEFYLGGSKNDESSATESLILLTSAYKFENSRYAQGEDGKLFHTHIPRAAETVLRHLFADGKPRYQSVKKRYACFAGALWAGTERYELELTYYSVTRTDDLKILMTAVIKYAENKVRAYLSIKSRLSVSCLPEEYRVLIDTYFAQALPPISKEKRMIADPPAYEVLYEPLSEGVSLSEAEHIEKTSWENTWRLIPEEEKREIFSVQERAVPPFEKEAAPQVSGLGVAEAEFLALLLVDGGAARKYAKERSLSYFALGEAVNEYFSDVLGDVVLLLEGEAFTVIPDYENEIRDALASCNPD